MKGRFVDVPVSERQIRLMINENDVHVIAHVFDGTVDLGQLLRVRAFTARQHTTHGDRRGHRFRFLHEKFHFFFNFVGWHFSITSRVPPTITIFVTSRLSSWRTSSIMSPMSSSVAPDFLRMAIVSIPTAETSLNKLFPARSVTDFA